jgi:tRNA threonylcarbamoyladenosine biosynthesis protein TsaE
MVIVSGSIKDTLTIGRTIASRFRKGGIICLFGELGSGKTVLVKGIAEGLGIHRSQIQSPSFVLMREYIASKKTGPSRIPLYHFDLYRLQKRQEILNLGYEEYFYAEGLCVIEWADRLGVLLPNEYLGITLKIKSRNKRKLTIVGYGRPYEEIIRKLKQNRNKKGDGPIFP